MSLTVDIHKKLRNFSLDVAFSADGGTLGLLGMSGSGKSMTLKCIAGIERPDRGRIVLNGTTLFDADAHIDLPPQKRKVGYLFQSYALFPNMTVRQNILCGMHGERDRKKREAELRRMVDLLQLDGLERHKPHQLSGGQQQRVALARILVNHPELLMLDEPFSALDVHLRDRLQIQMKELLDRFGRDVLLVTHDQNEAYHLCEKAAVVDEGQILSVSDTTDLFRNPQCRPAARLIGCKNIADAKKIGENEVEVPPWGVRFTTSSPVGKDLKAVGIRPQAFSPDCMDNRFAVRFLGGMERPFESQLCFSYEDQADHAEELWWSRPRQQPQSRLPKELGVSADDILLLYQ